MKNDREMSHEKTEFKEGSLKQVVDKKNSSYEYTWEWRNSCHANLIGKSPKREGRRT